MLNKYLYLILILGFINLATALTISPNPANVTSKINQQASFNVTFTNNHDFAIQDFSFTNLTDFTFSQFTLQNNESKQVEFKVTKSSPIEYLLTTTVKFNYLVEVPSTPQTLHINITPTSFTPNFLVIHEQDTIVWTNTDTITHTVTGSSFDLSVPPGQTVQRIFSQKGTYSYQDLVLFFGGTIEVLNRTTAQAVHNPNYDAQWQINLNIIADPTSLELTNQDQSYFEIDAFGSNEGLLKIKNIGSEIAQSVKIYDRLGWISPNANNFNLAISEQKFIPFKIFPNILSTNETNKNYTINIKAKSSNSEEVSFNLTIFVPYKDVDSTTDTDEGFLIWFENYCKRNPNLIICNNTIQSGRGNGSIIYRDPEVTYNFSTSTILDMLRRQRASEDVEERNANRITTIEAVMGSELPESKRIQNETLETLKEMLERERRDKNVRWIIGTGVILVALIVGLGYKFRKYNMKKSIMEGYS